MAYLFNLAGCRLSTEGRRGISRQKGLGRVSRREDISRHRAKQTQRDKQRRKSDARDVSALIVPEHDDGTTKDILPDLDNDTAVQATPSMSAASQIIQLDSGNTKQKRNRLPLTQNLNDIYTLVVDGMYKVANCNQVLVQQLERDTPIDDFSFTRVFPNIPPTFYTNGVVVDVVAHPLTQLMAAYFIRKRMSFWNEMVLMAARTSPVNTSIQPSMMLLCHLGRAFHQLITCGDKRDKTWWMSITTQLQSIGETLLLAAEQRFSAAQENIAEGVKRQPIWKRGEEIFYVMRNACGNETVLPDLHAQFDLAQTLSLRPTFVGLFAALSVAEQIEAKVRSKRQKKPHEPRSMLDDQYVKNIDADISLYHMRQGTKVEEQPLHSLGIYKF